MILLALALHTALAHSPDIVAGNDLLVWHQIEQRHPFEADRVEAYRDFIAAYPSSPLTEVAWDRLRRIDGLDPEFVTLHRKTLISVERSWRHHQEALLRRPARLVVAPLAVEQSLETDQPSPWSLHAHLSGGWQHDQPIGTLGAELRYGIAGVVARVGVGRGLLLQGGLRVTAPGWGPWGEATLGLTPSVSGTGPRLDVLGGVRAPLRSSLWFEAGAGVGANQEGFGPAARLGLVYGR